MAPGERALRRGSRRPLAAVLTALVLGGCIEVEKLQPGPLIIDNFEDDDTTPFSRRFSQWRCATFSGASGREDPDGGTSADASPPDGEGSGTRVPCAPQPGGDPDGRGHALTVEIYIQDPRDGRRENSRIEVATSVREAAIDASAFQRLGFSALIEADPATFPVPVVEVELQCGGAVLSQRVTPFVVDGVWAKFQPRLSDFSFSLAPRNPACMREVDGIRFTVRPALLDGQTAQGAFRIDNVYLDPES